jgi:type II secretion system protein I
MATNRVEQRPQGGFTLIEVMVAILLTALTTIGVLALYRVETRSSSFSRRETEAAVLAQDKLEQLRTKLAAAETGSDTPTDQFLGAGVELFTREWTVEPSTSDPSIFMIKVTVSWDDGGIPRHVDVYGQRSGS